MKTLLFTAVLLLSINIFSQTVKDVHSEKDGFNVKIHYTLENAQVNQVFHVKIYYSINNQPYTAPIQKTEGDVGEVIGNGKKIAVWDVLSELGELKGEVKFKVVAVPVRVNSNPKTSNGSIKGEITKAVLEGNQLSITCNITNTGANVREHISKDYCSMSDYKGNKYYTETLSTSTWNGSGSSFDFNTNIMRTIIFKTSIIDTEISELSEFIIARDLLVFKNIPITRL